MNANFRLRADQRPDAVLAPDDAKTLGAGLEIDYRYNESRSRCGIADIAINDSINADQ